MLHMHILVPKNIRYTEYIYMMVEFVRKNLNYFLTSYLLCLWVGELINRIPLNSQGEAKGVNK